jgi:hypothetical protein
MNQIKIAYFAGFFDGEGSAGIAEHKSKSCKRGYCHELMIQISNSNKTVLLSFQQYFGGSICPFKAPLNLPMWRWTISSKKALYFLELLLPFLKVKKHQAQLGISFQVKKRHRNMLSNSEFAEEITIRNQISELNRKGLCSKNNLAPVIPKEQILQEWPN